MRYAHEWDGSLNSGTEINRMGRFVLAAVLTVALILACGDKPGPQAGPNPPYPPSPVVSSITWDFGGLHQDAPGSDIWPITWASDGNLYTAWGDGGGFGGTNTLGRVSLGVARVSGQGDSWTGANMFGGFNGQAPATFIGKAQGIVSVAGVLYMIVCEQDQWLRGKIGRSDDLGRTWTFNNGAFADSAWDFTEPGGAFCGAGILQFGRDYAGARDEFVYGYDVRTQLVSQSDIVMFRVPKNRIMSRSAYEFFAGFSAQGIPLWTSDVTQMKPVFSDPNGASWGVQAFYHPVLHRYFLAVSRDSTSAWGLFDAPEPWGPWTTVAYYDSWIDPTTKFSFSFNQKWMSADGMQMFMVFSGIGAYDSFNVVKATLSWRTPPPSAPSGLTTR
jgi:hypothetical protein